MRKIALITLTLAVVATGVWRLTSEALADNQHPAPAFTHHRARDWINSKPLTWNDLRGKVVLLDFWAFECWNCYRSFPWLTSLNKDFAGKPFVILSVHTPEFQSEHNRKKVAERARRFGLKGPIMVDNDHSYWNVLDNHYWPAYYLIDKRGNIRAIYVGETHAGSAQAQSIGHRIAKLLDESAPGS